MKKLFIMKNKSYAIYVKKEFCCDKNEKLF